MEHKVPPALKYFDIVKGADLNEKDLEDYSDQINAVCDDFPKVVDDMKNILAAKYEKVYAIGIGDSLYSAESVKLGFWKESGIQIEVLESQEFNNYYIDYMPTKSLVLVCSGGGAAARTVETSYLAQKRGATVVAVTLTPKSRLSASCENVLCYTTDAKHFIDGSRNYISLALLLKIIGIKLGSWNGTLAEGQADQLINGIKKNMYMGFKTCINHEQVIKKIMFDAKDQKQFYFLGAGPSLSVAQYGAAKFMEQAAVDGIWQQLEEYGHEQYWTHNRKGDNSVIISICPGGKTAQRCAENIDEQNFLNQTTVVLTTSPVEKVLQDRAKYTLSSESNLSENDYWMVACNILARMGNYYTEYAGLLNKKFLSAEQFVEHYKTIQFSKFIDEVTEFDIECPDDQTIAERGAYGLNFETKKN